MSKFLLATVLLLLASTSLGDEPIRLISAGWNAPTMGQFARDLPAMPGDVPLTGCVMTLHADSGVPDPLATTHGSADWSGLDVERSIAMCRDANKQAMPDTFLLLKANPGGVDWLDDEGWKTIIEHYRIAAAIAKRAGLRGLLLDFEPYTDPYRQFQYAFQSQAADHSFQHYAAIARGRGREMMNAIASEFPDAELATFFMLSYLVQDHHYRGPSPVGRRDARWCLAGHTYGLLPAMIDGWLDVIPSSMTLVDGCENGYWFTTGQQFFAHAADVRERGVQLVSEANRDKYRQQVKVAFPLFLDAIHPTLAGAYTLTPWQRDRLQLLRNNLAAAKDAGDGLVWLYGERGRWWPEAGEEALWQGKDVYPTWEEQLPGISSAIRATVFASATPAHSSTEPAAVASRDREDARDESDPPNQRTEAAQGHEAATDAGDSIGATLLEIQPTWDSVNEGDNGSVTLESDQVQIKSARDAAGLAVFDVDSERKYMIQAHVVQQGCGMTRMAIEWQRADGTWIDTKRYSVMTYPEDGDPTQPRLLTAMVQSPPVDEAERPYRMVVRLGVRWQISDDDEVLFGNVLVGMVDQPTTSAAK